MGHKIEYSQEEMMQSLAKAMDALKVLQYDGEYRTALGQAMVEKLANWERNIQKCRESPFTVVVIGDFKRGKSTLINALLGQEVVTTDVTTETVTLNRISYGVPGNEAILSGNRRVRLTDEELRRDKLENLVAELGEPILRLELKRPCPILEKMTIIDTPGTGDAMQDFSDMVKDSLLQADAVIYVYNVQYPLSKSEQMFLKAAVLPQKYTKLFMVGNFSDILRTENAYNRMEQLLMERVSNLLPGEMTYMISALDALCHGMGESVEETELTPILRRRFADLTTELQRCAEDRANTVVLDRMQRMAASMVEDLSAELSAIETGLNMDTGDAAQALEKAQAENRDRVRMHAMLMEDLDAVIRNMKVETNTWMGDFIRRIIQESKSLSDVSNDDLKRYYEFYCVDLMQEAMNTCVEYHREHLYDLLDEVAAGMGEKISAAFYNNRRYSFRINLDNRVWTKGDTVGLATSYVAGANYLTFAASLIADGISGSMREREKQKRTPEMIEQISRKLLNLSAMASQTIDAVYNDLGNKAKQLIVEYSEAEAANARHLLEQVTQIASQDEAQKTHIREIVEKAGVLLEDVRHFVSMGA